jgi:hypothetical protein
MTDLIRPPRLSDFSYTVHARNTEVYENKNRTIELCIRFSVDPTQDTLEKIFEEGITRILPFLITPVKEGLIKTDLSLHLRQCRKHQESVPCALISIKSQTLLDFENLASLRELASYYDVNTTGTVW